MDVLSFEYRKQIIDEILGPENKERKAESLRRFEVYAQRQRDLILEKLQSEFSARTVKEMRTITSINLTQRIINEKASVYKQKACRTFNAERDLTESELIQIDNIYKFSWADVKFKKSNKFYKLMDQCAIQVLPVDGVIDMRVLAPHHYDVIPSETDPQKADAYIVSYFDKTEYLKDFSSGGTFKDQVNQQIGDPDDYKRKQMRFIWWTNVHHFETDGHGFVIQGGQRVMTPSFDSMLNPIQKLPFVDVAYMKDFEFWLRYGSGVVDFDLDFSVILSDTANINKLQGYAQAVIASEKPPQDMIIGPNAILHLPLDPNKEVQPSFSFASPNPDMAASLNLLETYLTLFLTSQGIDPKTISGRPDAKTFSSGIERLLSNIEKFEATRDDFDLFELVEKKTFELFKAWSNVFQGVTSPNPDTMTMPLIPELQMSTIPEDTMVNVTFHKPEIVQTKTEKEDSTIKLMDAGLVSRLEAIMELRGVDKDTASKVLEEIDATAIMFARDSGQAQTNPVQ